MVDDFKLFGGLDDRQTDIGDLKVAFATEKFEKYSHAKIYFKGKTASELSSHISKLHNLEHFSLKKDCNLKILQSLVGACSDNLKVLDVESCNFLQVTFCK